jgi:hypothetical protein
MHLASFPSLHPPTLFTDEPEINTAHDDTVHIYQHRQMELVRQTSIFHWYVRNIAMAPIRCHALLTGARENVASNDSGRTKRR